MGRSRRGTPRVLHRRGNLLQVLRAAGLPLNVVADLADEVAIAGHMVVMNVPTLALAGAERFVAPLARLHVPDFLEVPLAEFPEFHCDLGVPKSAGLAVGALELLFRLEAEIVRVPLILVHDGGLNLPKHPADPPISDLGGRTTHLQLQPGGNPLRQVAGLVRAVDLLCRHGRDSDHSDAEEAAFYGHNLRMT